VISKSSG